MSGLQTEQGLQNWRFGQTQAERLVAALLHLEGYDDVDPQHPLGGPDGLKDVLCRRNGQTWIAAAYFPLTPPSFKEIKKKFEDDSLGVDVNNAQGFCFFLNQKLTIGERDDLMNASPTPNTEIYHLERIVGLLNAPKGCGIRLEYLRIAMSEEEQWAFWSTFNSDVVKRLSINERRLGHKMDDINAKIDIILMRTNTISEKLTSYPSSLNQQLDDIDFPTASISAGTLCWLHRVLTADLGLAESVRGCFRAVQVWVGPAGADVADAVYVAPPPENVPRLVEELLLWWKERHPHLRHAEKSEIASSIAQLHHKILFIHPFLDRNGQVSRCVIDQAARELLNQSISKQLTDNRQDYYEALREADRGNIEPLTRQVLASLI